MEGKIPTISNSVFLRAVRYPDGVEKVFRNQGILALCRSLVTDGVNPNSLLKSTVFAVEESKEHVLKEIVDALESRGFLYRAVQAKEILAIPGKEPFCKRIDCFEIVHNLNAPGHPRVTVDGEGDAVLDYMFNTAIKNTDYGLFVEE